ncbi:hypothetical protein H6CHR_02946 [Variovorax sp. PBL-H6]|uniref:hypothetical protein n=1 Tax=Variovorax sp. PBL-H6 TaxID=434009 RepID=UPI001316C800|nr:hypothetical protein [Variovorax sp. PBL-H6]VTU28230.1 hypothetical protein H6CHR_02946 [Variovorax sp. PBL-H6]
MSRISKTSPPLTPSLIQKNNSSSDSEKEKLSKKESKSLLKGHISPRRTKAENEQKSYSVKNPLTRRPKPISLDKPKGTAHDRPEALIYPREIFSSLERDQIVLLNDSVKDNDTPKNQGSENDESFIPNADFEKKSQHSDDSTSGMAALQPYRPRHQGLPQLPQYRPSRRGAYSQLKNATTLTATEVEKIELRDAKLQPIRTGLPAGVIMDDHGNLGGTHIIESVPTYPNKPTELSPYQKRKYAEVVQDRVQVALEKSEELDGVRVVRQAINDFYRLDLVIHDGSNNLIAERDANDPGGKIRNSQVAKALLDLTDDKITTFVLSCALTQGLVLTAPLAVSNSKGEGIPYKLIGTHNSVKRELRVTESDGSEERVTDVRQVGGAKWVLSRDGATSKYPSAGKRMLKQRKASRPTCRWKKIM